MAQLNALQKYESMDYRGLITDNHLGMLYMQEPKLMSPYIQQLYTTMGASYVNFVNRFPTEYVEDETAFYEWMLQGQHERNLPLVDIEDMAGNKLSSGTLTDAIGANKEMFYLVFGENLFDRGDVIKGKTESEKVRVFQVEDYGSVIKYRVQILTDDLDISFDPADFSVGDRWFKDFNLQPNTLSYEGSEADFSSPFRLQNRLSTMRFQYKVPGNMIAKGKNQTLKFPFMTPNGTAEPVWINYLDWMSMFQADQQYARMLLFGEKNWTSDKQYTMKDEKNGFNIESGAGLFSQIAPGNKHYYNKFDLDTFVETLVDQGIGRLERGKRVITVGTGERGAIEISKQIQDKAKAWTMISQAPSLIRGASANNTGAKNAFGFGGQWTTYEYVNGVVLNVEIFDFFDDQLRHSQPHPEGKGNVESHRMIAFDYGGDAGIKIVKAKSAPDSMAYLPGMRDPFSPGGMGKPKLVVSPVDGYEVHHMRVGGVKVTDPTKIVDYQLNVD